jgi:hypothetical protein
MEIKTFCVVDAYTDEIIEGNFESKHQAECFIEQYKLHAHTPGIHNDVDFYIDIE